MVDCFEEGILKYIRMVLYDVHVPLKFVFLFAIGNESQNFRDSGLHFEWLEKSAYT